MPFFSGYPEKIKLIKKIKLTFARAGWSINEKPDDRYDFYVSSGSLCFFVRCLDEATIKFGSVTAILDTLESHAREMRGVGNRQLIVVFSWNFLVVDLRALLNRGIVAIEFDELSEITMLSSIDEKAHAALNQRQRGLLEGAVDYSVAVSKLYYNDGDMGSSLQWARGAVKSSAGYSHAHLWLFQVLRNLGDLDAATELSREIASYRPDNPHFLLGMEDLYRKRGQKAEAEALRRRLNDRSKSARSFEDILAKQRAQNKGQPSVPSEPVPSEGAETPRLSWLRGLMRRPSKG